MLQYALMVIKTKIYQENKTKVLLTAISAWVLALATLASSTDLSRISRQPVVVNFARPTYAYANADENIWARNDSENETVHLPTKFDIGLQMATVGGRK